MKFTIKRVVIIILLLSTNLLLAQTELQTDTLKTIKESNIQFKLKQLVIPSALLAYGVIGIENDGLKDINLSIRSEVLENIDKKITVDDFSQYVPAISVYALNFGGIKGRNNLRDRTIILGTSYLLMGTSIYALKKITNIERPDGTSNSFPSGHTATAFAGAEFLWQEYKSISVWYGISGYLVASGTGLFRIYNNKHWLTDVLAGAGIGILTSKIAYWMFPYINNHIFKSKKNISAGMVTPYYNGNQMGIGMILNFK